MISIRTDENGKVTSWALVLDDINPFEDGTLVDTTAEFMEQHFGVDELTLVDGALTVGDTLPPVEPPKSLEQQQIEALQLQNGELLFKLAFAQDDLQQKTTQMGMMLMQLATSQGGV